MHRVGIELDKVEVRFEDLRVTAFAESAGRTLPSIWNSYANAVTVRLQVVEFSGEGESEG